MNNLEQIKEELEKWFGDKVGREGIDMLMAMFEKTIKEVEKNMQNSCRKAFIAGTCKRPEDVKMTLGEYDAWYKSQQETGGAEDQEEFRARNRPAGAEQQPSNKLSKESEK